MGWRRRNGDPFTLTSTPQVPGSTSAAGPGADCSLVQEVSWANQNQQRKWEIVRGFCGQIVEAAERQDLDPHLLAALIWWESGGDQEAYSSSGAVGLMQVMPRDGLASSFECGEDKYSCFAGRPTIEELKIPSFNISYGSNLLREKIEAGGSIREGLRLYGPRDVGYYYADRIIELTEQVTP